MAKSPRKPTPAALRDAFLADLPGVWASFFATYPDQTPYAFVLAGREHPVELTAHVLTEEGLTTVATRYVNDGYYDTLDEARDALRYSVDDSPWFPEREGRLPAVDALWNRHADDVDDVTGYRLLAPAAMEALKKLDKGRLFGTGRRRQRLLLAILTAETEEDWTDRSAKKLNPPAVYKRFDRQARVEGTFAKCETLAAGPDGRTVYAVVHRDLDEDGDDSVNELIAYRLRGRRLERRWAFAFPTFGDAGLAVAPAPDGKSVVLMRRRYVERVAYALLMRFPARKNKPEAQHEFPGEPASFAASADGGTLAVGLNDKTLHLFDADLRPLRVHPLKRRPADLLFLRDGTLLVATDGGVLKVDPATGRTRVAAPGSAHRLSGDDAGRLLAVSAWPQNLLGGAKRGKETPVRLLRLPSLKPVRSFAVPGHHAVGGTLSPDGALLALEAHEMGKPRRFVAVFDAGTGAEVARRKSDFVADLAFLRNGRTLGVPESGAMAKEPITLWKVR